MGVLDMFKLDGKVAAVTGCTRGIGKSMTLALAEAGADIALVQRDITQTQLRDQLRAMGRKCEIVECDMFSNDSLKACVPAVVQAIGRLDIMVLNAGIQRRNPPENFTEQDWDDVIQVNLKAVWVLAQAAGQHMLKAGIKGKIITTASLLTFQGGINVPAYAAAKGGVKTLTHALSNAWAKHGLCVNAIAPGYIATDMNTALTEDTARSEEIVARIPAGRWGTPDDFKGAIVYLASSASDYVSGEVLVVDGGWMGR
ncbi:hypothetical protein BZG36_04333 [Bifiguratus adelaidae]|uniref:Ketoreductase domain-containing protein n=1 Tax=Bifiguratus adelaidae TaxID=1938954 RepID=A0A261XWE6_9FUNG|nr:hypothetical protein BZG36_04333 [Bifiguratus adelaidae]